MLFHCEGKSKAEQSSKTLARRARNFGGRLKKQGHKVDLIIELGNRQIIAVETKRSGVVGGADVLLGKIAIEQIVEPLKVWISLEQFADWKHTHITIDAVPRRGGGFSLETPEGLRFIMRSRIFTDEEWLILKDEEVLPGSGVLKLV